MVERDPPQPASWDSASAFAILDRQAQAQGCPARTRIARAYATAIGWRIDAAEQPSVREARAAYLAELVAPCGQVSSELIDEFQSHPERALCDSRAPTDPATGFMFPWFLDTVLGAGFGHVPIALSAIGPQRTPPDRWTWTDEPDLFDSLRATLRTRPSAHTVGDLLLDFAVARLFWGDRDDGTHPPAASFAGSFGRIRFDWTLPYASLPRRVMPAHPIEPTGATYIWVDLASAPKGARLGFRAEWEAPVVFRWALVRVAADGRELSRVLVTPQAKSTSAERNVEDLDGLSAIAVVGVNSGDISEREPFDPDATPFEPHSCAITLAPSP